MAGIHTNMLGRLGLRTGMARLMPWIVVPKPVVHHPVVHVRPEAAHAELAKIEGGRGHVVEGHPELFVQDTAPLGSLDVGTLFPKTHLSDVTQPRVLQLAPPQERAFSDSQAHRMVAGSRATPFDFDPPSSQSVAPGLHLVVEGAVAQPVMMSASQDSGAASLGMTRGSLSVGAGTSSSAPVAAAAASVVPVALAVSGNAGKIQTSIIHVAKLPEVQWLSKIGPIREIDVHPAQAGQDSGESFRLNLLAFHNDSVFVSTPSAAHTLVPLGQQLKLSRHEAVLGEDIGRGPYVVTDSLLPFRAVLLLREWFYIQPVDVTVPVPTFHVMTNPGKARAKVNVIVFDETGVAMSPDDGADFHYFYAVRGNATVRLGDAGDETHLVNEDEVLKLVVPKGAGRSIQLGAMPNSVLIAVSIHLLDGHDKGGQRVEAVTDAGGAAGQGKQGRDSGGSGTAPQGLDAMVPPKALDSRFSRDRSRYKLRPRRLSLHTAHSRPRTPIARKSALPS
ncbi:MAG TPA: hypothetical protein DDW49_03220 [Deltaproteobacteria bacterium]|nr:hypothetical protein [Deltaproteobacteria bacterium]